MTPLRSLFRSPATPTEIDPVPLVEPRFTIDGWSLDDTPLAVAVRRDDRRELSTLMHGVAVRAETPWTYTRAIEMLEDAGEHGQAYAVAVTWLEHPESRRPENAAVSRTITRHRDRLKVRLGASASRSRLTHEGSVSTD